MLTILAWIVFIPALAWNFIFFGVLVNDLVGDNKLDLKNTRNYRDGIITLLLLFVPGVYLFGWF